MRWTSAAGRRLRPRSRTQYNLPTAAKSEIEELKPTAGSEEGKAEAPCTALQRRGGNTGNRVDGERGGVDASKQPASRVSPSIPFPMIFNAFHFIQTITISL